MHGKHAHIEGTFHHLIYSPKGAIEGVLLHSGGTPIQIVFEKHDDLSPADFHGLNENQTVTVKAVPQGRSPKGPGEHPVYEYDRLLLVDGAKPAKRKPVSDVAGYQGTVVRINYARHGAANGVILDSGDFIHLKPEGMAKLKLKIGDAVEADGDAHRLATDTGWAVEAERVNGKKVHKG